MSLSVFSTKNNYWKNGVWVWSKMLNRLIGENRYEYLRVQRRIWQNRIYYSRQQMLYEIFIEAPDVANLLGMYPKTDNSHGFAFYQTYEMYRDFQENTPNSDGWFGMWFVVIAGFYFLHFWYTYLWPYYWINSPVKNEEDTRFRIRDVLSSTVAEEVYGNQWAEWAWQPHDFHYQRLRAYRGYIHPDDPRVMHMTSFNRKHKYKEHYMTERVGDQHHMMYPR